MYKKITLKNGLRIIIVPQKSAQTVTVLSLVGVGSKYESKEISGISHFMEHMFFKGTKKRPNKLAIAESLDRIGGVYNAFTGQEYTGYFAKTKSSFFDLALDWVSDIFLNSSLPPKEMEKERGVIIEEINMIYDNPMNYVDILWQRLLYGNQPAGWDIAGTKETVSKINRQELIAYRKKHYLSSNTIVCVAGNIDVTAVAKKVKRSFTKIKDGKPFPKPLVVEQQSNPEVLLQNRPTDQAHLCLGVRGYNLFHPQRYALEVLSSILGGMMSSRLFIEVRERLGLAYYIRTESSLDPDTGFLVTQAGVDNKNVKKAIITILKEYKKLAQKKVPLKELNKVKNNIKGKMAIAMEPSDAKASFFAGQELLENRILTPEEIYKRIDQVSQDDILAVARDIFQPRKLNLALIGPFEKKDQFEKLLKRY